MGSIDQVNCPFFHFNESHHPTINKAPYHPPQDTSLDSHTAHRQSRALLPRSAEVLKDFCKFSGVIEQTILRPEARLDPKMFIKFWYSIQYQLLSGKPVEQLSNGDLLNDDHESEGAFRLGAINMKEILRELTFSATGLHHIGIETQSFSQPCGRV